jgi:hypothetical protein
MGDLVQRYRVDPSGPLIKGRLISLCGEDPLENCSPSSWTITPLRAFAVFATANPVIAMVYDLSITPATRAKIDRRESRVKHQLGLLQV